MKDVLTMYADLLTVLRSVPPAHRVDGKDWCGCEDCYQRRWAIRNLSNSRSNYKRHAFARMKGHP